MEQNFIQKNLEIKGMSCVNCGMRIENALRCLKGIVKVEASFSRTLVQVTYDANAVDLDRIKKVLQELGYPVKGESFPAGNDKLSVNQLLGIGIIVFAVYSIVKNTVGFNFIPQVNQSMGYGLLFATGLVTSLHCIAMCGGINLSQCISNRDLALGTGRLGKLKPSLMYNSGRVISYTLIGGAVGALGSVISFSGTTKGAVIVISGVFMFVIGFNMLGLVPWLHRLNLRMPKNFGEKIYKNTGYNPFYIGLLNGLMPCGPLQAMQLYALGTGSFFAGALSMFLFSLGTVPLMFGLGAISTFMSSKFTHRLAKASAVLIMVLGIIMVSRGFNLLGFDTAVASPESGVRAASSIARVEGNVQTVTTDLEPGWYAPIILQRGIPVRWTIRAERSDLNGCNNPVVIPQYGVEKKLVPGDNIIEFTPTEEGNVTYTCWMGMIKGKISVVADINNVDPEEVPEATGSAGRKSRW